MNFVPVINGQLIDSDGYILIKNSNHPNSMANGKIHEHRLVMSTFLGRKLKRSEDVHHINGVKIDNRIENLEIIDHKKHLKIHHQGHISIGRICSECGSDKTYYDKREHFYLWKTNPITKHGWLCHNCYQRIRRVK